MPSKPGRPHNAKEGKIGLRHLAAPTEDGFIVTPDPEVARRHIATANFFHTVFGEKEAGQETLHRHVMATLTQEVFGWIDEPIP